MQRPTSLEICAGAGGQALGVEGAGFDHLVLVENDFHACATLSHNRPKWNVLNMDLNDFDASPYRGVELFAGGVPCPPFSKAGKQLGRDDERDLFPVALRLIDQCRPDAVMLENVRGLLDPRFDEYREEIKATLVKLGYVADWKLMNAAAFEVPQSRARAVLVAIKRAKAHRFDWPKGPGTVPPSVGEALEHMMAASGWTGASGWAKRANGIAPTVVGGSKKHGGADLGPTRAKRAWACLDVDGHGIADAPPAESFSGRPRLTVPMVARIQGFPSDWHIVGRKTAAYRQVGNAFPPPVAEALSKAILAAISVGSRRIGKAEKTGGFEKVLYEADPIQAGLF